MKPLVSPYRLLLTLLYGQQPWLVRQSNGWLTLPVRELCDAAGLKRAETLRLAAQALEEWGVLSRLQWHGRYLVVQVVPPPGYTRNPESPNV